MELCLEVGDFEVVAVDQRLKFGDVGAAHRLVVLFGGDLVVEVGAVDGDGGVRCGPGSRG